MTNRVVTERPQASSEEVAPSRMNDDQARARLFKTLSRRWTLPAVASLLTGPMRFGQIRIALQGVSANILTQRLHDLGALKLVRRRRLPPPAAVHVYELTDRGYGMAPVFQAFAHWMEESGTDGADEGDVERVITQDGRTP